MAATSTANLLAGQSAIVTGAGGGVGQGIAEALAEAGASVVLAVRRLETGDPVAAGIRHRGGQATAVRCDVGQRDDVAQSVEAAVDTYGGLDIVVHNALSPVGTSVLPEEVADETWEGMLATAVRASFWYARCAHPHLTRRPGTFILLVSAAGLEGSPPLPAYATVKAAQRGLAKSLAREWGRDGIRVNCVAPVAMTPSMEVAYRDRPELEERLRERTALGRIGEPADIGAATVALASDLARFVAGQTWVVDGGGYLL